MAHTYKEYKMSMNTGHGRYSKGFTMIELMIVVVILGVIAAFAIPAYQDSIRKSKRSDAKTAISQAASRQEQYYLDRKTYADDLTLLNYAPATTKGPAGSIDSPERYYNVTVAAPAWGAGCFPTNCWSITAVAVDPEQMKDARCRSFTIDSRGNKTSIDAGGVDSSASCW